MFPLSSLILSSQFWPSFKNDTIELPEDLKKVFDCYTKSYEAYKGNRTLFWRPFIGRVELEIEVGNKKLDLSVSPIHAVIIYEFQKQSKSVSPLLTFIFFLNIINKCCVFAYCVQGSWRLADLSQKIQVPASVVRKKIAYWQAQGLIEETSSDNFTLIENIEQHTRQESGNQFDDLIF